MHPILETFDPAVAPADQLAALHAFTSELKREISPDDPPTPLEEAIAVWRLNWKANEVHGWLLRTPEGAVIGRAQVAFAKTGNPTIASGSIEVATEHRRRGHSRTLLAALARVMRERQRTLFIGSTYAEAPGGEAWLRRLGGEAGLENVVSQLRLESLDRSKLPEWLASERSEGFEIGFWDGPYPDADLEAVAGLQNVMATAPTGTLTVEPPTFTPALLRQIEAAMTARQAQRWTAYARERATGRFAGFTELTWLPRAPELLIQGNTAVVPEFRGHGLGLRLKAAMLERVLRERTEARFIRTTNAEMNEHMLAINRAMGFEPYQRRTIWQVSLESIESWLAAVTPS